MTPTLLELSLTCVLIIFFISTLIYQIFLKQLAPYMARYDLLRLLPAYRLFDSILPNPTVIYRFDSNTDWQLVQLHSPFRWWHLFWHPQHIVPDIVSTLIEWLLEMTEQQPPYTPQQIQSTLTFKLLQQHIIQQYAQADTQQLQLQVAVTENGQMVTRFQSTWVKLSHAL